MQNEELTVLYEDNHLLVVLKPQNVPTQGDSTGDRDLLTMVKDYIKRTHDKPGEAFAGLVHRLDRPTGGVMVFAKTSKAAARLSEQIREGSFEKRYLGHGGNAARPSGTAYRLPHERRKEQPRDRRSRADRGRETRGTYLQSAANLAATGASRYQTSHRKIASGESAASAYRHAARYGGDVLAKGHNLALWAYELRFYHPTTKTPMVFVAYPPAEKTPWKFFDIERYVSLVAPRG